MHSPPDAAGVFCPLPWESLTTLADLSNFSSPITSAVINSITSETFLSTASNIFVLSTVDGLSILLGNGTNASTPDGAVLPSAEGAVTDPSSLVVVPRYNSVTGHVALDSHWSLLFLEKSPSAIRAVDFAPTSPEAILSTFATAATALGVGTSFGGGLAVSNPCGEACAGATAETRGAVFAATFKLSNGEWNIARCDWNDTTHMYNNGSLWAPVLSSPISGVTPGSIPVIALTDGLARPRSAALLFVAFETAANDVTLAVVHDPYGANAMLQILFAASSAAGSVSAFGRLSSLSAAWTAPIRSMVALSDASALIVTDGRVVSQLLLRDSGLYDAGSPLDHTEDYLMPVAGAGGGNGSAVDGNYNIYLAETHLGPLALIFAAPFTEMFFLVENDPTGPHAPASLRYIKRLVAVENCTDLLDSDTAVCVLAPPGGECHCGFGEFSDAGGPCQPCSACPSGVEILVPCNSTADTVCVSPTPSSSPSPSVSPSPSASPSLTPTQSPAATWPRIAIAPSNTSRSQVAVTADGVWLAVGLPSDSSSAGSVAFFTCFETACSRVATVPAPSGDAPLFGSSLALSAIGNLVVGAAQAAFAFACGVGWPPSCNETVALVLGNATTAAPSARPVAVAVSSDSSLLVVGTPFANASCGGALTFDCSGGPSCTQTGVVSPPGSLSGCTWEFGATLSLTGDGGLLVVGAPGWAYTTGAPANGAAYLYTCSAALGCTYGATMTNPDYEPAADYATAVAVTGNTSSARVFIGAPQHQSGVGRVYMFDCAASGYLVCLFGGALQATDGASTGFFGFALAATADGAALAVGAPGVSRTDFFVLGRDGAGHPSWTLSLRVDAAGYALALSPDGQIAAIDDVPGGGLYVGSPFPGATATATSTATATITTTPTPSVTSTPYATTSATASPSATGSAAPTCGPASAPVLSYEWATLAADESTQGSALVTPGGELTAVTALFVTPGRLVASGTSGRLAVASIDPIATPPSRVGIYGDSLPAPTDPPVFSSVYLSSLIGSGGYGPTVGGCAPTACPLQRVLAIGQTVAGDAVWLQVNASGASEVLRAPGAFAPGGGGGAPVTAFPALAPNVTVAHLALGYVSGAATTVIYVAARAVTRSPLAAPPTAAPPGPAAAAWPLWVSFVVSSSNSSAWPTPILDLAALPFGASSVLLDASVDNALLWAAVNFAQGGSALLVALLSYVGLPAQSPAGDGRGIWRLVAGNATWANATGDAELAWAGDEAAGVPFAGPFAGLARHPLLPHSVFVCDGLTVRRVDVDAAALLASYTPGNSNSTLRFAAGDPAAFNSTPPDLPWPAPAANASMATVFTGASAAEADVFAGLPASGSPTVSIKHGPPASLVLASPRLSALAAAPDGGLFVAQNAVLGGGASGSWRILELRGPTATPPPACVSPSPSPSPPAPLVSPPADALLTLRIRPVLQAPASAAEATAAAAGGSQRPSRAVWMAALGRPGLVGEILPAWPNGTALAPPPAGGLGAPQRSLLPPVAAAGSGALATAWAPPAAAAAASGLGGLLGPTAPLFRVVGAGRVWLAGATLADPAQAGAALLPPPTPVSGSPQGASVQGSGVLAEPGLTGLPPLSTPNASKAGDGGVVPVALALRVNASAVTLPLWLAYSVTPAPNPAAAAASAATTVLARANVTLACTVGPLCPGDACSGSSSSSDVASASAAPWDDGGGLLARMFPGLGVSDWQWYGPQNATGAALVGPGSGSGSAQEWRSSQTLGVPWNTSAGAPVPGTPRSTVRVLLSLRVSSAAGTAIANASTVGSPLGRQVIGGVLARALWLPERQVVVWNITAGAATSSGGAWVHAVVLLTLPRGRFATPFGTAAGLLPPVVDATAVVGLRLREAGAAAVLHASYDPAVAPALNFAIGATYPGFRTGGLTAPSAVAVLWQALAEATLEAAAALQRVLGVGCTASVVT